MPQYFKGDDLEKKFDNSAEPVCSQLSLDKDEFLAGAEVAAPLGDVIFDDQRSPLSNAIPKEIFRLAFKQVFDAFTKVGTFEAYITVFKKIFGDEVGLTFTVPGPGQLQISIEADEIELSDFVARYIEENQYFFDEIIDHEGDNIVFQTIQGFQTQYELEQMLFEMVPAGIYTEISLTLGGS